MISLSHADIYGQRCASIPKEVLSYQETIENTCTLGRQFIKALLPTQEQANSITSSVSYMNTFADICGCGCAVEIAECQKLSKIAWIFSATRQQLYQLTTFQQ